MINEVEKKEYIEKLVCCIENYENADFDIKYKRLQQILHILDEIKSKNKILYAELGIENKKRVSNETDI